MRRNGRNLPAVRSFVLRAGGGPTVHNQQVHSGLLGGLVRLQLTGHTFCRSMCGLGSEDGGALRRGSVRLGKLPSLSSRSFLVHLDCVLAVFGGRVHIVDETGQSVV